MVAVFQPTIGACYAFVVSFLCVLLNVVKYTNIIDYFVVCYCGIQIYALSLYQQTKYNNITLWQTQSDN